uniref:Sm domain-containing protein n=1 Tax=Toxocara canis TaxID=6265 RepID=A0A183U3P1_TOXCA
LMDPFANDFDAERVLREGCPIPDDQTVRQLPSVDHFESVLCENNIELCTRMIAIETSNTQHSAASSTTLPTRKQRERRLASFCAKKAEISETEASSRGAVDDAKSPLASISVAKRSAMKSIERTSVLYRMSKGTYDGPLGTLQKWMKEHKRVCIILRSRSTVNTIITAVIVAFDKHWNIIIRDGDEKLLPSVRQEAAFEAEHKLNSCG